MPFLNTLLSKISETGNLFSRLIVSEKDGPTGKQGLRLDVSAQLGLTLSDVNNINRT